MRDTEKAEFCQAWQAAAELYGNKVSPVALSLVWNLLRGYELRDVTGALSAHLGDTQRGQYAPKPADIIRQLQSQQPQHVPADEAWSIALAASDEEKTVVWTREIINAWGVAKTVYDLGDAVGARMAFKAAYERELAGGQAPRWEISLGWDKQARVEPILAAEARGLISSDEARRMLPAPDEMAADMRELFALTFSGAEMPKDKTANNWRAIRARLDQASAFAAQRKARELAERTAAREREEARKSELHAQAEALRGE